MKFQLSFSAKAPALTTKNAVFNLSLARFVFATSPIIEFLNHSEGETVLYDECHIISTETGTIE